MLKEEDSSSDTSEENENHIILDIKEEGANYSATSSNEVLEEVQTGQQNSFRNLWGWWSRKN